MEQIPAVLFLFSSWCHVMSEVRSKDPGYLGTRAGGVLKLPPTGSELESGFLDSPFGTSGLPLVKVKMRSLRDLTPGCQLLQVSASGSSELEEGRDQRVCVVRGVVAAPSATPTSRRKGPWEGNHEIHTGSRGFGSPTNPWSLGHPLCRRELATRQNSS